MGTRQIPINVPRKALRLLLPELKKRWKEGHKIEGVRMGRNKSV